MSMFTTVCKDYEGSYEGVNGCVYAHLSDEDLLKAFVDKYHVEISEDEYPKAIRIAEFYAQQSLPLNGMLVFMKREFDMLRRKGTCRAWELYQKSIEPRPKPAPVQKSNEPFDPYRARNGEFYKYD